MSEGKKVLYKVETIRDSKMVSSFVKFTYRQAHPKVSRNFIIVGALSLALTYGIRIPDLRIVFILLGAFCLFMGFFRHWIPVLMLKGSDEDYVNKNVLTYIFTENGIEAQRNGDTYLTVDSYSRVHNLYHDEWYFYLGANEDNLMILPKDCFTEGNPDTFAGFISRKSGIKCYWSPGTRAEKSKKNRADAAVRAAMAEKMQAEQAAERERQRQLFRQAMADRKNRKSRKE